MGTPIQSGGIKECPFCGGTALLEMSKKDRHREFPYRVSCQSCFSRTDWFVTAKHAIESWNRRDSRCKT